MTQYDVILVSGPQRSGTRIATRMIAADTGYHYIDENDYGIYNQNRFSTILQQHKIVVHCPAMSHVLHKMVADNMLVVFMIRNLEDIFASEQRINWTIGPYAELKNYGLPRRAARRYRRHGGQIAPLKYARWWGYQREWIPHWLELEFESLAAHPLWIPKEQRKGFADKQTGL